MKLRTMTSAAVLTALLAGTGVHAAETPAAAPGADKAKNRDDCVFARTLNDWAAVDRETLLLYAPTRKNPYLVKLFFPSSDVTFNVRLGFEDRDRNGLICSTDEVVIPDGIPPRIPIRSMQKITVEEANALLAQAKEARAKKKDKPKTQSATSGAGAEGALRSESETTK